MELALDRPEGPDVDNIDGWFRDGWFRYEKRPRGRTRSTMPHHTIGVLPPENLKHTEAGWCAVFTIHVNHSVEQPSAAGVSR